MASERSADLPVQIVLRPLASPLPIGFFAFAVGSFLFSLPELGWVNHDQLRPTALIMLVFVAPLELIAGVVAFWARDAGGATSLCIFGMTWATVAGVTFYTSEETVAVLGAFLIAVSFVILALAVASASGKPVFAVVLTLASARFIITGLFHVTGSSTLEQIAGWLGFPLCAAALYLGLALLLEDLNRATVLPLFRRGPAKSSVERELEHQVENIEREAGVRSHL
jgi:succinate-acetate transporter protein